MVMTEEEKTLTAYHEAGHAIVGLNVPSHDPIHKATIIPRGRALGLVLSLPERDQLSQTKQQLTSKIAMAMGGRVAEEIKFGEDKITNGAASDIQQITRIARAMVTQFGMADETGMIDYANDRENMMGIPQQNISPETQQAIDSEVRRIVDEGYETAKRILTEKRDDLERLAQGLLEYETLTGDEITKVLNGEKLDRSDDDADLPPQKPSEGSHAAIPKAGKPKRGDDGLGDEGGPLPQPQ